MRENEKDASTAVDDIRPSDMNRAAYAAAKHGIARSSYRITAAKMRAAESLIVAAFVHDPPAPGAIVDHADILLIGRFPRPPTKVGDLDRWRMYRAQLIERVRAKLNAKLGRWLGSVHGEGYRLLSVPETIRHHDRVARDQALNATIRGKNRLNDMPDDVIGDDKTALEAALNRLDTAETQLRILQEDQTLDAFADMKGPPPSASLPHLDYGQWKTVDKKD